MTAPEDEMREHYPYLFVSTDFEDEFSFKRGRFVISDSRYILDWSFKFKFFAKTIPSYVGRTFGTLRVHARMGSGILTTYAGRTWCTQGVRKPRPNPNF